MSQTQIQEIEGTNRSPNETFGDVFRRRLSRRGFLKGALAAAPLFVIGPSAVGRSRPAAASDSTLTFEPIQLCDQDQVIVSPGYEAQVLIRWGEPLHPDVPPLNVQGQSADLQSEQFGYNCDFVAYFPLPYYFSRTSHQGILAVNHEYTLPELMFLGYNPDSPTQEQVDIQIAAHGLSFVEVVRLPVGGWRYRLSSNYNRRITGETDILLTGPAAGHDWMKVSYNPSGTEVGTTPVNRGHSASAIAGC
jgi:uncharacterized protein